MKKIISYFISWKYPIGSFLLFNDGSICHKPRIYRIPFWRKHLYEPGLLTIDGKPVLKAISGRKRIKWWVDCLYNANWEILCLECAPRRK